MTPHSKTNSRCFRIHLTANRWETLLSQHQQICSHDPEMQSRFCEFTVTSQTATRSAGDQRHVHSQPTEVDLIWSIPVPTVLSNRVASQKFPSQHSAQYNVLYGAPCPPPGGLNHFLRCAFQVVGSRLLPRRLHHLAIVAR